MKKSILGILIMLIIANFSANALPNVEMGWGPCISYSQQIGWYAKLNYNTWGGGGNFNFWVYYQGVAYGPILGTNSSANRVLFILPIQLNTALEKGECVDLAYNWQPTNQTALGVYQQATEEFYLDPLSLGYKATKLCPCPQNNTSDCIGHFNYTLNTEDLINNTTVITLDDKDMSYLMPTISNELNNMNMICEGTAINGPNGCVGIGSKKLKTTDIWTMNFSSSSSIISYNCIDNPGMYDASGLNLLPIYALGINETYVEICHKKTIVIGCFYDYGGGELSTSGNSCTELNEFYSNTTLFNCEVCQYICLDKPFLTDGIINNAPIETLNRQSEKSTTTSFNFVTIHPNPATNFLNINLNEKVKEIIDLKVTDIQGKVIKTSNYYTKEGQNLIKLNVEDLLNGMYFLQISSNSNEFREKFIIKK